jgi:hypothetical protein
MDFELRLNGGYPGSQATVFDLMDFELRLNGGYPGSQATVFDHIAWAGFGYMQRWW